MLSLFNNTYVTNWDYVRNYEHAERIVHNYVHVERIVHNYEHAERIYSSQKEHFLQKFGTARRVQFLISFRSQRNISLTMKKSSTNIFSLKTYYADIRIRGASTDI